MNASVRWDPDGAGPLQAVLVIGGDFSACGSLLATNVVAVDVPTGGVMQLGSGLPGRVFALAVSGAGELIAGGRFDLPGGAYEIAMRWNGSAWLPMGLGAGWVNALTVQPNGDVVAGGHFVLTAAGGDCYHVARWSGGSWHNMGSGLDGSTYEVRALGTLPNGDVVASGHIATSYGRGVVRWDGAGWSSLGNFSELARDLVVTANGDVVVVVVDDLSLNHMVARWNAATGWSYLGSGSIGYAVVTETANGTLLLGGDVPGSLGGGALLLAWNGTAWVPAVSGRPAAGVRHLHTLPNGDTIVGGTFRRVGYVGAAGVARFDGIAWHALLPGTNDRVDFHVRRNGDLIAYGAFEQIDGIEAAHIAAWDGARWQPLGLGTNATVTAACEDANGDLIVGGWFDSCGAVPANGLARWDGATWSAIPLPTSSGSLGPMVMGLIALDNGDLLVAGDLGMQVGGAWSTGLLRHSGGSWSPVGSGLRGFVQQCCRLPNGGVYVRGNLQLYGVTGARLAYWDGSTWTALPSLPGVWSEPLAIAVMADGTMVASWSTGEATVWAWSGGAWAPLGSPLPLGITRSLHLLPNGDLAAFGWLQLFGITFNAARWDGVGWSPLLPGSPSGADGMTVLQDGRCLLTTMDALANGGAAAAYFAWAEPGCPAGTASVGAGCSGSSGLAHLAAEGEPWAGSTFRAVATGVPANAVVVRVLGSGRVMTPLTSLLPFALAGCALLVVPDLLDLHLPGPTTTPLDLVLPRQPALVGLEVLLQAVVIELGASGSAVAATSSNALRLTIGGW
ncbi:MAG: hypothetical protein K8J09_09490 [Planctomycetes bacterium]|nr:hypothetical protein [Planctomycetota bacterium]